MTMCAPLTAPGEASTPAPFIRQRGQHSVFCGLTSIIWLHRKMQDAFFLIVGSRTCAHLMQSAAGVMIFAEPRFATAIIGERDLAGIADMHDELDEVVERLLERRPEIRKLVLVGSCPSEVIKFDLAKAAQRLDAHYAPNQRVIAFSGSGIETTFTQGEDNFLTAMVEDVTLHDHERHCDLLVAGSLSDIAEDQLSGIISGLGIENVAFLPNRHSIPLPRISENTRYILAQPYLGTTAQALERQGASRIDAPFPLGEQGTTAWLQAIARSFNIDLKRLEMLTAASRRRASLSVEKYRDKLAGKRIFIFPDSQLEPSLARFLQNEMGADIVEVGSPFIHRSHVTCELEALNPATVISEGQDVELQIDRCREADPDLIICGMGLANPFEAEGRATKWSIEFAFTPIHGYEQAGDLAELFVRPFNRRDVLELDVAPWN